MSRTDADRDGTAGTSDPEAAAGETPAPAELTGPMRRLDSRVRLLWLARAATVAAILGLVVGGLERIFLGTAPWLGPATFATLLAVGGVRAHLRYRAWRYRLRSDAVYLERGVLTRVETVVPYVRVQHVDARRSPGERLFGLSTVVVYTAGSQGADVALPGLDPERATDLRERLKRLAIAAAGEDAV